MYFSVTDFFHSPSEKGFHSGLYLGRKEKGLGQGSGIYPGASARNCGQERKIWNGSTQLLGRVRLQGALREREICLGPVTSKAGVSSVLDIYNLISWKTGL